jgi:hypothetical protein
MAALLSHQKPYHKTTSEMRNATDESGFQPIDLK